MVPSTILSRRPISFFDNPSDTRRMIWRSRPVSTVSTFSVIAMFLCSRNTALIRGGQRQEPLAVRNLPQGLHQNFERHILQNDTIGAGRGRYNQFAVINRCGEKDQPRGKTLGVGDAEDFQPGQAWLYTAAQQFPGTHL